MVEIGPGLGGLTRVIAERARHTVAIEVDRGLVELLAAETWPGPVEIRHEDVLEADLGGLVRDLGAPVVLLGNLPYRISGRLLGALLSPRNPFRRLGLMLQAEVADRVLAPPGTPACGPLSVWTRLWMEARRVLELGPAEFVPRPKVRSSFVLFDPVPEPPTVLDLPLLRTLVRGAFQQRRKMLRRALRDSVPGLDQGFQAAGIDSSRRGDTLSAEEFVRLANEIASARERASG